MDDPEPSRSRRRVPFGARLEVERDDAGVMGRIGPIVERRRAGDGLEDARRVALDPRGGDAGAELVVDAVRSGAAAIEDRVARLPARVQTWLFMSGGVLATAVAWFLSIVAPSPMVDGPGRDAGGFAGLAAAFLAVGGPAIAIYGFVRWRWPDPPQPTGAAGFGGGLIDEQRQRRLWLSRLFAASVGIVHYAALLSLT